MKNIIAFLSIFFLLGCSNNQPKTITKIAEIKKDSINRKDISTGRLLPKKSLVDTALMNYINKIRIKLPFGFIIVGCSITRNGERIYVDTLDPLIYNRNDLYPIIRDLGNNTFELLLQYGNAPNMDEVQHFIIKNNKVAKLDTLPSFFSKARNLDSDTLLEYSGIWDYRQLWGENADSACYEPIIFYEVRKLGIVLDSALTIKINKRIYGKFCGYYINEHIVFDDRKIEPILERAFDTLDASFGKK